MDIKINQAENGFFILVLQPNNKCLPLEMKYVANNAREVVTIVYNLIAPPKASPEEPQKV
jgi:hypothetical protein